LYIAEYFKKMASSAADQQSQAEKNAQLGASAFGKSRKVSSELLALTYGALVAQLCKDMDGDVNQVNAKLDSMGESIGMRIVDEVIAKAQIKRCTGVFKDAVSVVTSVGFKMYLGTVPKVTSWNDEGTICHLQFPTEHPLEEFVEIPEKLKGLKYSQILCGILRGSLEAVSMKTNCTIVKDRLLGAETTEIRIGLVEIQREMAGEDYRED
jgi:trafficking protein particle complex subunit 3